MSTRLRFVIWFCMMLVISVLGAMFASGHHIAPQAVAQLVFLLPFVIGFLTMLIWGNLSFRVGVGPREEQPAAARRTAATPKLKRDAVQVERLVDNLGDDELLELETLLLTREQRE